MSERVRVRATVHLPDLPVGATALVDAADPYVSALLDAGMLVREPAEATAEATTVDRGTLPAVEAASE